MNYNCKTQYDLYCSLRFLVDAAKTEPAMDIYKAHIKVAEKALESAQDEDYFTKWLKTP